MRCMRACFARCRRFVSSLPCIIMYFAEPIKFESATLCELRNSTVRSADLDGESLKYKQLANRRDRAGDTVQPKHTTYFHMGK